ncbi:hypothetical protein AB0C10_15710 [Microbispora amethystogenes]|uniref:hypothetical protein n=1 Tax=Microbispora amethystogenes TaxID=1427754 RepID=UPI0033C458FF
MAAIGLDFDGVIHRYSRGWHDGSIYDGEVPGALMAIRELMGDYSVFVFTSRNPLQVAGWIQARVQFPVIADIEPLPPDQQEFWDVRGTLLVTRRKIPALAYVDDRGIRFQSWDQALADIKELDRWRR